MSPTSTTCQGTDRRSSTSSVSTATSTPFKAALSAIAAAAKRSISAAVALAAPARAAASARRPEPATKSSTPLPRTSAGWSSTCRASAWPPAQAKAQYGGGSCTWPSITSVACQSGVISVARWRRISGTSGGVAAAVLARMKDVGSDDMRGGDADEKQPADPAVGTELGEAVCRIAGVDRRRLPEKLHQRDHQREIERPAQPRGGARCRPERCGEGIKDEEGPARARAERQRRGLHAYENVVLLVLMRVDRVVAERPGDATGIEPECSRVEPAARRRIAQQRTPVEIQSEEELRPVGHPL